MCVRMSAAASSAADLRGCQFPFLPKGYPADAIGLDAKRGWGFGFWVGGTSAVDKKLDEMSGLQLVPGGKKASSRKQAPECCKHVALRYCNPLLESAASTNRERFFPNLFSANAALIASCFS